MVAPVASAKRDLQAFHPFLKLNRLLDGIAPGRSPLPDGAPVALQVGEPQNPPPDFITHELAEAAAGWQKYPPPRGTSAYRAACADWLERRYPSGAGLLDPDTQLLPLAGTREGLFFTAFATVGREGRRKVLLPNPFYHVYAGAALAAGAEPVFVPATADNGFLPDYAGLDPAILDQAALAYLNAPSNPQGAVAGPAFLQRQIAAVRRHGLTLALDECYAEIYDAAAPAGAFDVLTGLGQGLDNLLVFHSLSKRSSAAGLRCGFVAGDAASIDALDATLRVGGAGVPLPVLAAGTRLWQEEEHVAANRARYRANFDAAERALGEHFPGVRPQAGFFLWLEVGDGEAAARTLWREAGLRVLPGAYMAEPDAAGRNPGTPYIRVALVYDAETTERALARLAEVLAAVPGEGRAAE